MGLLSALKLPTPSTNNGAKRGAVRRAALAAKVRRGDRRAVLNAAIDMAAKSGSNTPEHLDPHIDDDANPSTPVSTMAPKSAYAPLQGTGESEYVAGRLETETGVSMHPQVDPTTGKNTNDFDVSARV